MYDRWWPLAAEDQAPEVKRRIISGRCIMILYFSGTGNSRYVAKRIADVTGDEIVSINEMIRKQNIIDAGGKLVFVVPTYAWRIPKIVEQWILSTRFSGMDRVWFVMTCGDEIGNAPKYIRALCEEKHFEYMGTGQVVMPENYIAMFPVPKASTAQKIIRNAEPVIDRIAGLIAAGKRIPEMKASAADRLKSSIVNPVFYKMFVKADAFGADNRCTGCGKCKRLCPLNNIEINNNRPAWGKNCTHCMACISYCPVEAIEYGNKSKGKPRYRCEV